MSASVSSSSGIRSGMVFVTATLFKAKMFSCDRYGWAERRALTRRRPISWTKRRATYKLLHVLPAFVNPRSPILIASEFFRDCSGVARAQQFFPLAAGCAASSAFARFVCGALERYYLRAGS